VQAAIEGVDGLESCDLEIVRGGYSYTVDTVDELRRRDAAAELFLLVGSDVAASLGTWKDPERLRAEVRLVVMDRAGSVPVEPASLEGWNVTVVEVPALEVSSTDLRHRASRGRPLDFLIPHAAIRVIAERGLYARDR
jgi:nicotinate-nucleotide adenylyltransferase